MSSTNFLPIIRCFKSGKLVHEILTSDDPKQKYSPDSGTFKGFDWIEIIEPKSVEDPHQKKRLLLSCTCNTTKNEVTIKKNHRGEYELSIVCHIRDLSSSTSSGSCFAFRLDGYQSQLGDFFTFNLDEAKIDGHKFLEDKKNRQIYSLAGLETGNTLGALDLEFLATLGVSTGFNWLDKAATRNFAFVGVGEGPASILQCQAQTVNDIGSLELTLGKFAFKLSSSKLKFGQKARIFYDSKYKESDKQPFSLPGQWSLWSLGYPSKTILDSWNKLLQEPYAKSVYQKLSFVPELKLEGNAKGCWCIPLRVSDNAIDEKFDKKNTVITNQDPSELTRNEKITVQIGPIQPLSPVPVKLLFESFRECAKRNPITLRGQLRYINTGGFEDTIAALKDKDLLDKDFVENAKLDPEKLNFSDADICSKLWINPRVPGPHGSAFADARVGAFELNLPAQDAKSYEDYAEKRPYELRLISGKVVSDSQVKVSFEADFPLEFFTLVGQDQDSRDSIDAAPSGRSNLLLRDHHRFDSLPVVIADKNKRIDQVHASVSENNYLSQDPRISIRIKHNNEATSIVSRDLSAIVVDNSPFSVIKIVADNLFQASEDEGNLNEIAIWTNWDPDGSGWKLLSKDHKFDLLLPPQCVGEEFIKRKETTQGSFIKFKFSPKATITVQTDNETRRFGESPWNLRRILGYPSDRVPGCKLLSLKFELLYGLETKAETKNVLLTEMFSQLGWTPDYASDTPSYTRLSGQDSAYKEKSDDWNAIKRSLQSRLSILTPFSPEAHELVITNDLSFRVRKTAKLRYPIAEDRVPVGDTRREAKPFSDSEGLKGGVTWGFESANVLDSVMRDPNSTGGKLVNPNFSALGGWGYQKVEFQNGLTKIYSNTAMGRTFFYSVERLGRIAIFGNIAKHVVIYERTVAPSKQFEEEQDSFLGMPVVRKIREFIEVIEPVRNFPDSANDAIHRGFTKAIEFTSKIIPVNSTWGEDIGTLGWVIPLWNVNAAKAHSTVYPKPSIALHCVVPTAEQSSDELAEPILIDNPEMVYFYTCTLPGISSDPHNWNLVSGIDFPLTELPKLENNLPGADRENPDRPLAAPARKVSGIERFTFELVDSDTQPNLSAARSDKGMAVSVNNVVLCRLPSQSINFDSRLSNLTALKGLINQLKGLVDEELLKPAAEQNQKYLDSLKSEYGGKINAVASSLKKLEKGAKWEEIRKGIQTDVSNTFQNILRVLEASADSPLQRLYQQLEETELLVLQAGQNNEYKRILSESLLLVDTYLRSKTVFTPFLESHVLGTILENVEHCRYKLEKQWSALRKNIDAGIKTLDELKLKVKELLSQIAGGVTALRKAIALVSIPFMENEQKQIIAFLDLLLVELRDYNLEVDQQNDIATLLSWLDAKEKAFFAKFKGFEQDIEQVIRQLEVIFQPFTTFLSFVHSASKFLIDRLEPKLIAATASTTELVAAIKSEIELLRRLIREEFSDLSKILGDMGQVEPFKRIVDMLDDVFDPSTIKATLVDAAGDLKDLRKNLEDGFYKSIEQYEKELIDSIKSSLPVNSQDYDALAKSVFTLQAAACKRLNNPPFSLNREEFRAILADGLKPELSALITPSLGLLSRAKDELNDLKALGMRIPTNKILDRVLPSFDTDTLDPNKLFTKYFPDLAGLKLDGFMKNLRMEKSWEDRVFIEQGLDPSTGKAWLRTKLQIPISQTTLFEKEPIRLVLANGEVFAESFSSVDTQGVLQQRTNAHIQGDWLFSISGLDVLEFQNTRLYNDASGEMKFDISPSRVNLKGVLGSISDLMAKIPGASSAFEISRAVEDAGKPISIDCDFDMALPDISGGCFSLKGLNLNAGLGVSVTPADFKSFAINTRLSLCRKDAPFIMTIFCLGGGGWFEFSSTYFPLKNKLATFVSIGVAVAASFDIALGPIKGGVGMSLGIGCEFSNDGAGNSKFAIVVIFTIKGEVDLCGIVSAYISLSLSLTYERSKGNSVLIGRGNLEVEIEICWCFTLSIDYDCEYTFAGGESKTSHSLSAGIDNHAETYVNSLQ